MLLLFRGRVKTSSTGSREKTSVGFNKNTSEGLYATRICFIKYTKMRRGNQNMSIWYELCNKT